jgi:hypothetical protein
VERQSPARGGVGGGKEGVRCLEGVEPEFVFAAAAGVDLIGTVGVVRYLDPVGLVRERRHLVVDHHRHRRTTTMSHTRDTAHTHHRTHGTRHTRLEWGGWYGGDEFEGEDALR